MVYSLEFDDKKYIIETVTEAGQTVTYRAFENIVYVKNPVYPENQQLSIFVPEGYYQGESIGHYDCKTAPIFLPNTVGGYMPGFIERPGRDFKGRVSASFLALCRGYVVVSPALRGRGLQNDKQEFIGTAPAVIIDLKSVVRYLRHNKDLIPGNVERIISNGTSAGGAISSLLGSTGNHGDYEPYLKEAGAADQRDDIWAASCYCPITNLDHADMAYEWEFCGINTYRFNTFSPNENGEIVEAVKEGVLSDNQVELSKQEKALFPNYLNSLHLKDEIGQSLTLDESGQGSFLEYVKKCILKSIQLEAATGTDLSVYSWITWENGRPASLDFADYIAFRTRMKPTPAFDDVANVTPENELFGSSYTQFRHFTPFSRTHSSVGGEMAEVQQIKMMNPMNYIDDKNTVTAKHFRIRHGAIDRDTSLSISAMLTLKLQNCGAEVDYQLPWGVVHDGDYDLKELFDWIEKIVS